MRKPESDVSKTRSDIEFRSKENAVLRREFDIELRSTESDVSKTRSDIELRSKENAVLRRESDIETLRVLALTKRKQIEARVFSSACDFRDFHFFRSIGNSRLRFKEAPQMTQKMNCVPDRFARQQRRASLSTGEVYC